MHLAEFVRKKLKLEDCAIDVRRFQDGELTSTVNRTVRNKSVYLVQSTSQPVNENLMELLIATDMLKRASASSITVIIPYFGYARQDRKSNGREPITARLVANLIETAGATRVILMDIHSEQAQGFFNIPVDSLRANAILMKTFLAENNSRNLAIVSPDYGGVNRARRVAEQFNLPLAIIDKRRPRPNEVEVSNVLGKVEGKHCLIIDDIIDTGRTIVQAAALLKQKGAVAVYVMATHGVFSGEAPNVLNDAIDQGLISRIIISNSIPQPQKRIKKLVVAELGNFFSEVILAHETHSSVSEIYGKHSYKRNRG
ncbi:unnamed protein product [Didymodactylos carnosus]|uniref:ribose-phosphate diphosphokinase n=1 Tax=Didymodactylos carnosus TaxID=1234261 RepID=A0A8S2CN91_9BILA|nr:unnamed protein product [Didymodactylos carnosus]CAF3499596.1 unnamed protein product [Didymodactylos carnosus]